jgi:hypothetical protein
LTVETARQAASEPCLRQEMNQFSSATIRFGAGEIRLAAVKIRNPQEKSGLAMRNVGKSLWKTGSWHGKSGL